MNLEICKNEYAELIVKAGIQLKPGEKVIINSDVTIYDMTRRVCEVCYQEGASSVEIRWSDSRKEAMDFKYADEQLLMKVDKWEEEQYIQQSKELPCLIHLLISDSITYSEAMQKKQAKARVSKLNILLPYIQKMQNKYKWTAVCIPTQVWADQVFPNEKDNLKHLWEDVLHTLMITGDGQSIQKWDDKWHTMWDYMDRINALGLKSLHLESELGTDLTVNLHPKVKFACASGRDDGCATNLPSEELFTSPIAGQADGKIVASCPLIYENQLIEELELTFKNGKACNVKAKTGEKFFKELINTDEGASMLGEIAIVDKHSPVKALKHLLYHTLYDENAACHIAIGRGFPFVIENYKSMSHEEINACKINQSGIHCDIMWGTDDTKITGITRDNQEIVIMNHGEWCF